MTPAFTKLAAAEEAFASTRFLAPVAKSEGDPKVRVRIAGVVMTLAVTRPKKFIGWGIFQPTDHKHCRKIREAGLSERRAWLDLFRPCRLVLCRQEGDDWLGALAGTDELGLVRLTEGVQVFDEVKARWDGAEFWFDAPDERADPRLKAYLSERLADRTPANRVSAPGMAPEHRVAYGVAFQTAEDQRRRALEASVGYKVKSAIERAGGAYLNHLERAGDGTLTVTWRMGSEVHRSTVRRSDLSVVSAGICLNSTDQQFDMNSLCHVVREGQQRRLIVRVGDNR